MPDSKVKELSDMPWKQREESGTWQKERVIQELRSQGKRMTKQRMILLDVILSGKWNCCKEIYYEAAKRDAAIGMATVYTWYLLWKKSAYSADATATACRTVPAWRNRPGIGWIRYRTIHMAEETCTVRRMIPLSFFVRHK